ncbi:MAG: hypothetical protein ACR2OO_09025, partial [Thermomicrobiales bacterium]
MAASPFIAASPTTTPPSLIPWAMLFTPPNEPMFVCWSPCQSVALCPPATPPAAATGMKPPA